MPTQIWETMWKMIIYSFSFFLSSYSTRKFTILYHCRHISSGDFSQKEEVKMKHFSLSEIKCVLKYWTFFTVKQKHLCQSETPIWKFQTDIKFVYLVSVLVVFTRSKILIARSNSEIGSEETSSQHSSNWKFWDASGKKGILQQTKQHKAMGQVCNSVNALTNFQTVVFWPLIVLSRLLNVCRSRLICTYLLSTVISVTCLMIRLHNLHKK